MIARTLVNAAGPWAAQFLREQLKQSQSKSLRLIKGSHIVVKKHFDHDHAYLLQNPDRRIIFAIPYEGEFTLIGTTEVEHHGGLDEVRADDAEIAYLCEQASRYFVHPITPADVVWSYAGVRPLIDDESADASAVTRDYLLEFDTQGAPLLTVWGGKITTFRKLAEEAADLLCKSLGSQRGAWTASACLPGGDLSGYIGAPVRPDHDFVRFEQALAEQHPLVPATVRHHYARCYGSRISLLLNQAGLGDEIAPGLFETELNYLRRHEWAHCADDVLWRRTKLGLHMSIDERAQVAVWCLAHWRDDDVTSAPAPTPASASATAIVDEPMKLQA